MEECTKTRKKEGFLRERPNVTICQKRKGANLSPKSLSGKPVKKRERKIHFLAGKKEDL